jgi:LasA protease
MTDSPHNTRGIAAFVAVVIILALATALITRWHSPTRISRNAGAEGQPPAATASFSTAAGEPPPPLPATREPTRAYPGFYAGTPTPNPTPAGYAVAITNQSYVVQQGDTLSSIALAFGCTVDEVAAANGINPNAIWPGQRLTIPTAVTRFGPALKLIPDSELVYGPASIHFDLEGFVTGQRGYLASYSEEVEGQTRTGIQVVQLVAQRYSVGPRVLLALLELEAGWVTNPTPAEETLYYPMGHVESYLEGLFQQLSWAAAELNSGYYGWKYDGRTTLHLVDGSRVGIAPGLNAGSVGVQNVLGQVAHGEEWERLAGPEGFAATYESLFGNPFAYEVEPLLPPGLTQPELRLPWEEGEMWYLTGGPHGGWGRGSGWAALDFAPAGEIGCQVLSGWATAAAPGLVLRSTYGEVVIDLDGDGYEQSGWVLTYLHLHSEGRVEAGTWVERGQPVGHPSCEGGYSIATHLHLARRYNGEWIPAGDGPVPLVLSGWVAQQAAAEYDGTLTQDGQVRVACECSEDDYNGLLSDNTVPE